jgi:hypothetical protein
MTERNVFLILIRLDLQGQSPLGIPSAGRGGRLARMEEGKEYALLVGLLDPSQQVTRTPFTEVRLEPPLLKSYNDILDRVELLVKRFYGSGGYVADPARFNGKEQGEISQAISAIGRPIFDLVARQTPLSDWFDDLFGVKHRPTGRLGRLEGLQVTIITNDFDIPWYWMKATDWSKLLCEVCSLGMLQLAAHTLSAVARQSAADDAAGSGAMRALLINGMADAAGAAGAAEPWVRQELDAVTGALDGSREGGRRRGLAFRVDEAANERDLDVLTKKWRREIGDPGQRRLLYRVVHYAGHWSLPEEVPDAPGHIDPSLLLNGERLFIEDLDEFIDSSLLVLDGCSSSAGLRSWADTEGLTAQLLGRGALGCIVTVLPVKIDPVVAEVFWASFYSCLLGGRLTLGQALAKAREALRQHFKDLDSENPSWAFYQLIGNPSVHLLQQDVHPDA